MWVLTHNHIIEPRYGEVYGRVVGNVDAYFICRGCMAKMSSTAARKVTGRSTAAHKTPGRSTMAYAVASLGGGISAAVRKGTGRQLGRQGRRGVLGPRH